MLYKFLKNSTGTKMIEKQKAELILLPSLYCTLQVNYISYKVKVKTFHQQKDC